MSGTDWSRRRAVVSGGARGIGASVSKELVALGASVAIIDLRRPEGEFAEAVKSYLCDVADWDELGATFEQVCRELADVNLVVNCAGLYIPGNVLDFSQADWDRLFGVNVKGSFRLAQLGARRMVAQGSGGVIVNIGSIAAELSSEVNGVYGATKGAVESLTRALAVGLAQHNIRVNAVAPGPIGTAQGLAAIEDPAYRERMLSRVLRKRLGTPDEVAAAVTFLASDEADYITGTVLHVDGGVLSLR